MFLQIAFTLGYLIGKFDKTVTVWKKLKQVEKVFTFSDFSG